MSPQTVGGEGIIHRDHDLVPRPDGVCTVILAQPTYFHDDVANGGFVHTAALCAEHNE